LLFCFVVFISHLNVDFLRSTPNNRKVQAMKVPEERGFVGLERLVAFAQLDLTSALLFLSVFLFPFFFSPYVYFSRGSQREIKVFEASDLSKPIATQTIDVSPSVLVPFYDEDTSVLFLWGRVSFFSSFLQPRLICVLVEFIPPFPSVKLG
jgi:hypothetical protein